MSYALTEAALVTPQLLSSPTPCPGWDLETLLDHVVDSIRVLHEAIATGGVSASAAPGAARPGPTRWRGCAATQPGCSPPTPLPDRRSARLSIGDRELTASLVAIAGATEIAVHGWDISVACGAARVIPSGLAALLLPIAPLLITAETRPGLFADPVRLPGPACPGDELVAFLGRQPRLLAPPEPRGG